MTDFRSLTNFGALTNFSSLTKCAGDKKPAYRAEIGFSVITEDDATVVCEEACAWVVLHLKITTLVLVLFYL